MNKDDKRRIAYEILIFLGLMALLCFLTRIWVILFLIILGIFIAALRLLYLSTVKVEIIEPVEAPENPPPKITEQEVLSNAYSLIQLRISEHVTARFPAAKWVWDSPNAFQHIADTEPVYIMLNGAGGYQKALVQIHNLQFKGISYVTAEPPKAEKPKEPEEPDIDEQTDSVNTEDDIQNDMEPVGYGYLAFEWVEANLRSLDIRSNEAIGHGETYLLIPSAELPDKSSWQDICAELVRNGFDNAMMIDEGIQADLPPQ